MKTCMVAVLLFFAPLAAQAQRFVAYETGDPYTPLGRALGVYTAVDWRFGHVESGPLMLLETAFGFRYAGPTALLESIEIKTWTLEGHRLGISFLHGPMRGSAKALATWSVDVNAMIPDVVSDYVGRTALVTPTASVVLNSGDTYWVSLFADTPANVNGWGNGVWGTYQGDGTKGLVATSGDRGATWAQGDGEHALFRVTARVPEPSSAAMLLLCIAVFMAQSRGRETPKRQGGPKDRPSFRSAV